MGTTTGPCPNTGRGVSGQVGQEWCTDLCQGIWRSCQTSGYPGGSPAELGVVPVGHAVVRREVLVELFRQSIGL